MIYAPTEAGAIRQQVERAFRLVFGKPWDIFQQDRVDWDDYLIQLIMEEGEKDEVKPN